MQMQVTSGKPWYTKLSWLNIRLPDNQPRVTWLQWFTQVTHWLRWHPIPFALRWYLLQPLADSLAGAVTGWYRADTQVLLLGKWRCPNQEMDSSQPEV